MSPDTEAPSRHRHAAPRRRVLPWPVHALLGLALLPALAAVAAALARSAFVLSGDPHAADCTSGGATGAVMLRVGVPLVVAVLALLGGLRSLGRQGRPWLWLGGGVLAVLALEALGRSVYPGCVVP